tara:strand:+ start:901 stop:1089 length:189 start_codon:yes stop_codon:yes gene_type:complete
LTPLGRLSKITNIRQHRADEARDFIPWRAGSVQKRAARKLSVLRDTVGARVLALDLADLDWK